MIQISIKVPEHLYRILVIGGSESRINALFNSISQKIDIAKIYLYANNPNEAKH